MKNNKTRLTALFLAAMVSHTVPTDVQAQETATLPPLMEQMLEEAYARGQGFFDETVKAMLSIRPGLAEAIRAKIAGLRQAGDVPTTAPEQGPSSVPAGAEQDTTEGLFGWDSRIELGVSSSSGDTNDQSAHLGFELKRVFSDRWDHSLSVDVDLERANSITSRERYYADYALYYRSADKWFGFAFAQAEDDRFSGYDYEFSESIGVGYSIYKRDDLEWDVQGGPGLRQTKNLLNGAKTHFAGFANSRISYQITENLLGINKTKTFIGSDRFSLRNELELQATISESLSAQFSLLFNYDSKVPLGSAKLDTLTRASLVYSF